MVVEEKWRRWESLLHENLRVARRICPPRYDVFASDEALVLSFEALVIRVGDLAKRLQRDHPDFAEIDQLTHAARARDFAAHHYHRVDTRQLWNTVHSSFPELEAALDRVLGPRAAWGCS